MKGWVYVISNRGMPDIVKVGFSTKDPELRAAELNHTGSPHPYLVEYELLIDEPRDIEQRVHLELRQKHEAKEWFRCSAEHAVAAIKTIAGSSGMHETYKRLDRVKAEQILSAEAAARESHRSAQLVAAALEKKMCDQESTVRERWTEKIRTTTPHTAFECWWLVGVILVGFGEIVIAELLFPKANSSVLFWALAIGGGWIAGKNLEQHFDAKFRKSQYHLSLLLQRDTEIAAVRAKTVNCPTCKTVIRAITHDDWRCPKCDTPYRSAY